MSLADIYERAYGANGEQEKVASEIEQKLGGFTDEEVQRLDAAGHLLDSYGMEFEDGHKKLAAAAELLDALEEDGEEKAQPKAEAGADDKENENLFVDEDGNVFEFLGNANETGDEDEKTAAEHDAAGRIMARAFLDEING